MEYQNVLLIYKDCTALKKIWMQPLHFFNKIDVDISRASIQECFRLGQYKGNSTRPRPILAKLSSTDVINLLA